MNNNANDKLNNILKKLNSLESELYESKNIRYETLITCEDRLFHHIILCYINIHINKTIKHILNKYIFEINKERSTFKKYRGTIGIWYIKELRFIFNIINELEYWDHKYNFNYTKELNNLEEQEYITKLDGFNQLVELKEIKLSILQYQFMIYSIKEIAMKIIASKLKLHNLDLSLKDEELQSNIVYTNEFDSYVIRIDTERDKIYKLSTNVEDYLSAFEPAFKLPDGSLVCVKKENLFNWSSLVFSLIKIDNVDYFFSGEAIIRGPLDRNKKFTDCKLHAKNIAKIVGLIRASDIWVLKIKAKCYPDGYSIELKWIFDNRKSLDQFIKNQLFKVKYFYDVSYEIGILINDIVAQRKYEHERHNNLLNLQHKNIF